MAYEICTDYFEIVSGEKNHYGKLYTEATKDLEKGTPKGLNKMKKLIEDIDKISGKVKDSRISSTRGDITKFKGYDSVNYSMNFLKKHLPGKKEITDLVAILNGLTKYKSLYQEGYSKSVALVTLEYENAVYLLTTGMAMLMATDIDFETNNAKIKVVTKTRGKTNGVIISSIRKMSKELQSTNHGKYLQSVIDTHKSIKTGKSNPDEEHIDESVYYSENVVTDIFDIVGAILGNAKKIFPFLKRVFIGARQTLLGIIPLLRSVLYIRYKYKADTISELESQCRFIQENIYRLEKSNMDPAKKETIIQKQRAYIEMYRKRAEKIRAQMCEAEREASTSSDESNHEISSDNQDDDDLVLEYFDIDPSIFKGDE